MKKIYILLAALALSASSCKRDFIDLLPEDSLAPSTFYQTDAQLQAAALATYVPLRDVLVNDYFTSEMHADNTHYQPSPGNRGTAYIYRESGADWNNDANNDYINSVYYHCYTGISRANILIGHLAGAQKATDAGKNKAEGQAKFLRALYYFKLVRLFGGVPLHLTEVTKADEAFLPRASVDEVYAQIIADATDAIAKLEPPKMPQQTGEATKGSATVLLADVFVTLKRYGEAEILLNTLPAMAYSLVLDGYAKVFNPANKNGRESMFEVQYLAAEGNNNQPNPLPFQFLPRSTNTTNIIGAPNVNTSSSGGWNKPVPDLIETFEPGDKRLDVAIGVAEGTYDANYLMTISANKSILGYTPAAGKIGYPYIKKFLFPAVVAGSNNTSTNWPIYRYAEALLLLAEALNEQGKSPLTPLNDVRSRAGLNDITETNKETLRDIIFHERRVELAFENKRFHDLQRNPKGLAIMQAYATKAKATYPLLSPTAFDIQPYKFLMPIPQSERGLNTDLTQNPGYSF